MMLDSGGRPPPDHANRLPGGWVAAALLFPLCVTVAAWHCAVDVPYWDQWDWLDRLYGEQGAFEVRRYWPLLNEHRVVVPLAIDWLLFEAVGVDMRVRALLKIPISLVSLASLVVLFRDTVQECGTRNEAPRTAIVVVVFSALLFPAAYWPMWFDPRNYAVHLAQALTLLGVVLISTRARAWTTWTAAAVCSLLAALATTVGTLAWPAGLVVLWWRRYPVRALVLWLVAAGAVVAPHAIDLLASVADTPAAAPSARALLKFFLAFAGRPVSPAMESLRYWPSMMAGACGLLLLVAGVARAATLRSGPAASRLAPWYVLAAWAVAIAGMATAGRASTGGLDVVHDARFVVAATPLWIAAAAFALFPGAASGGVQSRWSLRMWRGAWALALTGYIAAGLGAVLGPDGGDLSLRLATGRRCVADVTTAPDVCLQLLHPVPAVVRRLAPAVGARESRLSSSAAPRWLRESWGDDLSFDIRDEPAGLPIERAAFVMRRLGDIDRVPLRDGKTVRFPALRLTAPSALTWRIRLPAAGSIGLSTAVRAGGSPFVEGRLVGFTSARLAITSRDGPRQVWRRDVSPTERALIPVLVDLTPFAGEEVELVLEAGGAGGRTSRAGRGRVEWLHPEIVVARHN